MFSEMCPKRPSSLPVRLSAYAMLLVIVAPLFLASRAAGQLAPSTTNPAPAPAVVDPLNGARVQVDVAGKTQRYRLAAEPDGMPTTSPAPASQPATAPTTTAPAPGPSTRPALSIIPGAVSEPQTVTVTSVSSNPSLNPNTTVN